MRGWPGGAGVRCGCWLVRGVVRPGSPGFIARLCPSMWPAPSSRSWAATWRTRRACTSRSSTPPRGSCTTSWGAGLRPQRPGGAAQSSRRTAVHLRQPGRGLRTKHRRRQAAVRALREHTPHRGRRVKQRRGLQADRTRDRAAGGRRASGGDGAGQRPGPGSRVRSTGRGSDRDADAGAGHPAGIGLATNADEGCDEHPAALNLSSLCGSAASRSKGSPDE